MAPATPAAMPINVPSAPINSPSDSSNRMICFFVAPIARMIESCRRRSPTFIRYVLRMMNTDTTSDRAVASRNPCSLDIRVSSAN